MMRLLLFVFLGVVDAFSSSATIRTCNRPYSMRANSLAAAADATVVERSDACDVAIFGGGFGGLYTALAISRQAQQRGQSLDIVLVEPSESFVFLPLLYDLTVGTATETEVCPDYRDLLAGTGVRQVKASLESFDAASNTGSSAVLGPSSPQAPSRLNFQSAVVAVGASPERILASVPGALDFAQPFYTAADAKQTRRLLARLEDQATAATTKGTSPTRTSRVAIVGGGFGGVELAASVQRKLPSTSVTLLSRGAPMAGTRAEPLIHKALERLGVTVEMCSVEALSAGAVDSDKDRPLNPRIVVKRKPYGDDSASEASDSDTEPWDAVLWTAGSAPAQPVSDGLEGLRKSDSGRLAIDSSLRCFACEEATGDNPPYDDERMVKRITLDQPAVWALGDCAEIVAVTDQPAVPRTAQAAMQQADVVAFNLLAQLEETSKNGKASCKQFQYQDLGSMLMLGGPNGALMAPKEGAFAPLFAPMLDTFSGALGFADKLIQATVERSPVVEKFGLDPATLGLSLGSYGLGVESGGAPGTLAGTLTGAARRAVYAARMPTNRQRAVAATSAAISTAAALAKEATARNQAKE